MPDTPIGTPQKKLRVGWFTFSCCEDSTVIFTELMNERWQDWKKLMDFRHARVLQAHNVLDQMDVAFIEGALNTPTHVAKAKEIRKLATMVVAIGACACTGLPSTQRNTFNAEQQAAIKPLVEKFDFLPRGQKLADAITVDAMVPGCPMDEKKFLALIDVALKKFGVVA